MPRTPRRELGDGVYHVTARGVNRTAIVVDDEDGDTFVQILRLAGQRAGWKLGAYCLMPNHYHLVVACPLAALSRGMHLLNTGYASYFNARHERTGHLFQSRYDARVIEGDRYYEAACLYVVGNPVRAELCERVTDWAWTALCDDALAALNGDCPC